MRLRRDYPVLRQSRFLSAEWNAELDLKDSTWLTPAGAEMTAENWQDGNARSIGLLLDGRAQMSGIKRRGSEATLLLIANAHHDVVVFTLPKVKGGRDWQRLIDTNLPQDDERSDAAVRLRFGHPYHTTGRSLLLFLLRPGKGPRE